MNRKLTVFLSIRRLCCVCCGVLCCFFILTDGFYWGFPIYIVFLARKLIPTGESFLATNGFYLLSYLAQLLLFLSGLRPLRAFLKKDFYSFNTLPNWLLFCSCNMTHQPWLPEFEHPPNIWFSSSDLFWRSSYILPGVYFFIQSDQWICRSNPPGH